MKIYTDPAISTKKLVLWLQKIKDDGYRTDDERHSAVHLLKMIKIDTEISKLNTKSEEQKDRTISSLKTLIGDSLTEIDIKKEKGEK
jgi:hypothetical protein